MPQYYNVEQNKNMEQQNVALNNPNFDFFFFVYYAWLLKKQTFKREGFFFRLWKTY